jgi:hypothetical protein
MKRLLGRLTGLALLLAAPGLVIGSATVLYQDHTIGIRDTLADPNDLWIPPSELTRVNGFELKPEGACLDEICVPVKQHEDSAIFITRGETQWFNVTELARRLQQPFVADHEAAIWSFGAVPATRAGFLQKGVAPDFTLTDRRGREVTLADYDGMKVLLLTWASW